MGLGASTATNAAGDGRAAAHPAVAGSAGCACRYHPGRGEHSGGSGVREDRRDAGGDRPVHAAAPDGRLRRAGFIAASCCRRGFRYRGHPWRGPRRAILTRVIEHLRKRRIRFAVSTVLGPVREQLDRYGISAALGPGAYYDTPGEALEAYHAAERATGEQR